MFHNIITVYIPVNPYFKGDSMLVASLYYVTKWMYILLMFDTCTVHGSLTIII